MKLVCPKEESKHLHLKKQTKTTTNFCLSEGVSWSEREREEEGGCLNLFYICNKKVEKMAGQKTKNQKTKNKSIYYIHI